MTPELPANNARPRNLVMDALATACGWPLNEIAGTTAKRLQKAITSIKEITIDVGPAEIARRAKNYRRQFQGCALTPEALAKHWTTCSIDTATASPFATRPAPLTPVMR